MRRKTSRKSSVLSSVSKKQFDILVIDDGSPDGTAAIVKGLMANEFAGRLHILERSGKLGLGTAYIMGLQMVIEAGL